MPRQDVLAGIPSEAELGPLFGGPLQLGLTHERGPGMKSLRQLLFPRDPLLPGSRLQNMKALLQMTGELRVIPAARPVEPKGREDFPCNSIP